MGILYRLTFANGKRYIGISERDTVSVRLSQHRYMSKNGSKLPVHCAWRKHGEPACEVLAHFCEENLYAAEIAAIREQNTLVPSGYNILEGGQKSPALNESVKKKISAAAIERYKNPEEREKSSLLAKNRSRETREKISNSLTGKRLSDSTKEKIRIANIGKKHKEETKAKMSNSHKGKKYSEETIENMRRAAKKRMESPEAKAQLKAASAAGGGAMREKAINKLST